MKRHEREGAVDTRRGSRSVAEAVGVGLTRGIPVVAAVAIAWCVANALTDRRRHHVGRTARAPTGATASGEVGELGLTVITTKSEWELILKVVVVSTN